MIPALKPHEVIALLKLANKIQFLTSVITADSLNGLSVDEKELSNIAACSDRLRHSVITIVNR